MKTKNLLLGAIITLSTIAVYDFIVKPAITKGLKK